MANALLYSTHVVSISGVTLQNQTGAYMLDAESLSLTDVTIASHSAASATAAICTDLNLSGTLTLDLNSPCYKLLSRSDSLTCNTDFSGIIINIGNGFRLVAAPKEGDAAESAGVLRGQAMGGG